MIVLKKNFESSWRWIFIWKISDVNKDIYENWENILFQEYIDTSVWIKWIVEWKHDIRVTVVNGKIISSNIRQPKDWSFLANFSAWWSWYSIEIDQIPKELIEKVREIENNFKEYYPMVFSIDFMNSKNWFKLVELNSRPWVQHISKVKKYYIYNNALADLLIETVENINL
jgi:glutathione synthase/RimK-type ligase-like ATP-grasp enzyme